MILILIWNHLKYDFTQHCISDIVWLIHAAEIGSVKSTITDEPRYAVLDNTWRIRGAPVVSFLVSFG